MPFRFTSQKYHTPAVFSVLAEKRQEFGEAAGRLKNGLAKIIDTRIKVCGPHLDSLESVKHRAK